MIILGEQVRQFDEIVGDITGYWKLVLQYIPSNFDLTQSYLSVYPSLRALYRWSVALEPSDAPTTSAGTGWNFKVTATHWNLLVATTGQLCDLISEVRQTLSETALTSHSFLHECVQSFLKLWSILEKWSTLIVPTSTAV